MRTRRSFLRGVLAGGGVASLTAAPVVKAQASPLRMQTTLDLVGVDPRAWEALQGWGTDTYGWPGSALSASCRAMYWGLGLAPIVYARWLLVWNPQGAALSAVRLIRLADAFSPETTLGELSDPRSSPIVSAIDVTAGMCAWQRTGQNGFVAHQLRGTPVVFASTLEIVWGLA